MLTMMWLGCTVFWKAYDSIGHSNDVIEVLERRVYRVGSSCSPWDIYRDFTARSDLLLMAELFLYSHCMPGQSVCDSHTVVYHESRDRAEHVTHFITREGMTFHLHAYGFIFFMLCGERPYVGDETMWNQICSYTFIDILRHAKKKDI